MGRVLAHQVGQLTEQAKFFCVLFASPFILDTWLHFVLFFFGYNLDCSLIPQPYHTTSTLGIGCNLGVFFPCSAFFLTLQAHSRVPASPCFLTPFPL